MGEGQAREFVTSGRITEEQLATAQQMQSDTGGDLMRILVKLGFLKEHDLLESIASKQGLEVLKTEDVTIDEQIVAKLPRELLEKNTMIPVSHTASHLRVAVVDPNNLPAVEDVRFRTGLEVDIVLATSRDIERALGRHFGSDAPASGRTSPTRSRHKMDAREVARQVGVLPAAADAARAVADIDASPAKLMRAVAALLIEKRVFSATELKDWVHRLE